MSTTNTTTAQSTKLVDVLYASITATDAEKAKANVDRVVKTSKMNMAQEVGKLDLKVDSLKDQVATIKLNPNSTAIEIVNAERELKLAELNFAEATAIYESRF